MCVFDAEERALVRAGAPGQAPAGGADRGAVGAARLVILDTKLPGSAASRFAASSAAGIDQVGIAERLSISPKTVATHLQRVLAKLGVRSWAQAVAVAPPGTPRRRRAR